MYKCDKPVVPRDVEKLVPPAADDNGNVEPKYKRQRNEICEAFAVDGNVFKHSAQRK